MQWVLGLALLVMSGPVLAGGWACTSTLSLEDEQLGISDISFKLNFTRSGRFSASMQREPSRTNTLLSWLWMGQWTRTDDQVAMIGTATTTYLLPSGYQKNEVRAHSTVFEDDILMLSMTFENRPVLVRCLHERL